MGLFDSEEEDPLLQGDPLSPSDEDAEDTETGASEPPSEGTTSESDPLLSSEPPLEDESIFDEDEAQIVVRSEEEISSGQLAALNAVLRRFSRRSLFHLLEKLTRLNTVLREGWVLDRIELRNPPSSSLAFILKRSETDEPEDMS